MPSSGSGALFRLHQRPRITLICTTSRHRDACRFSSPSFSRHQSDVTVATMMRSRGFSSRVTTERSGVAGVDTSQIQKVNLDSFRSRLKERANALSAAATLSLAEVGGQLNKATGYEHIEVLKHKIGETEAAISTKRQAARDAKAAYETAVARRSNSQREVNDLLQRKSNWTDADVSRFTILVREDHLYEQAEARTKIEVALAEAEVEVVFNELMRTILNRYHEEQVWSDKIRSISTYGSLIALGVNIFVFFLAIIVVEPWKRRRLAQTFEKRIEELSLENHAVIEKGINDITERLEKREQVFTELMRVSLRGNLANSEADTTDAGQTSGLPVARRARTLRDRDPWIAGAVGVVGGSVLTALLIGFFKW